MMDKLSIAIDVVDSRPIYQAMDELRALIAGRTLELKGECLGELRELFVDGSLDAAKLVRVDSYPSARGAGYVTVSFQPSDLFLQLLAAFRAGQLDGMLI